MRNEPNQKRAWTDGDTAAKNSGLYMANNRHILSDASFDGGRPNGSGIPRQRWPVS